ncbi:MAG: PhzF family phenazine biosynthesis protein, partial [Chloroflexi bacterium]
MTRQIRIVDVFTEKPLAGNQLAVVLDGKDLSVRLMQR